jgi:Ca2+-binding RTX toxin-like protein
MATIQGTTGNDTFNKAFTDEFGGKLTSGNDQITGNGGADTFVFGKNGGKDTILDWSGNDKIKISQSKVDTWKELKKAMDQKGSNVEINLGNGSKIVIKDTKIKDLKKSDFDF